MTAKKTIVVQQVASAARRPARPRAGANARFFRDDDPRVKVRRCLMCGGDFWSAHAGNRMCAACIEKAREL